MSCLYCEFLKIFHLFFAKTLLIGVMILPVKCRQQFVCVSEGLPIRSTFLNASSRASSGMEKFMRRMASRERPASTTLEK